MYNLSICFLSECYVYLYTSDNLDREVLIRLNPHGGSDPPYYRVIRPNVFIYNIYEVNYWVISVCGYLLINKTHIYINITYIIYSWDFGPIIMYKLLTQCYNRRQLIVKGHSNTFQRNGNTRILFRIS